MTRNHAMSLVRGLSCLIPVLMCLACVGCEAPGFVAHVIKGPPKVDAAYALKDRPTLVMVDDPQDKLGDRNDLAVIGANVGYHLIENEAITEDHLVTQDRLSAFVAEQGERYRSMPIDAVGRQLGADQVIYVLVKSSRLQSKNTYYEPTAVVEVKVIDARAGRRLFPDVDEDAPGPRPKPGHSLTVQMKRQTLDETRRYALSEMSKSLAERVGLEVAQLFYKHLPPDSEP